MYLKGHSAPDKSISRHHRAEQAVMPAFQPRKVSWLEPLRLVKARPKV